VEKWEKNGEISKGLSELIAKKPEEVETLEKYQGVLRSKWMGGKIFRGRHATCENKTEERS